MTTPAPCVSRVCVQLHLRDILKMKDAVFHRLYEIERASSVDALLAEAPAIVTARPDPAVTAQLVRETANPLRKDEDQEPAGGRRVQFANATRSPAGSAVSPGPPNGFLEGGIEMANAQHTRMPTRRLR